MIAPLLPMLATAAAPIDSDEHVFEVKWDGVRALAAVNGGQWQLWGRERSDYHDRYPELAVLRGLPAGTVVDGEVVLFREGRADLPALLRRHHLGHPDQIRHASRVLPVCYVVFDLLGQHGRSLRAEPLVQRRAALAELLATVPDPRLVFSEGVVGPGRAYFDQVVTRATRASWPSTWPVATGPGGARRPGARSSPGRRCPA
jgi:bifunctional non-homologous end joining protein LigD